MTGFLIWVTIGYLTVSSVLFINRKKVIELWNDPYSGIDLYRPGIVLASFLSIFAWPLVVMSVPLVYIVKYKPEDK